MQMKDKTNLQSLIASHSKVHLSNNEIINKKGNSNFTDSTKNKNADQNIIKISTEKSPTGSNDSKLYDKFQLSKSDYRTTKFETTKPDDLLIKFDDFIIIENEFNFKEKFGEIMQMILK
jgi:hypothetical protein